MAEHQKEWAEGDLADQLPDMGTGSEGHLKSSNQSSFNECSAQEHEKPDDNELNKTDARDTVSGMENV